MSLQLLHDQVLEARLHGVHPGGAHPVVVVDHEPTRADVPPVVEQGREQMVAEILLGWEGSVRVIYEFEYVCV